MKDFKAAKKGGFISADRLGKAQGKIMH